MISSSWEDGFVIAGMMASHRVVELSTQFVNFLEKMRKRYKLFRLRARRTRRVMACVLIYSMLTLLYIILNYHPFVWYTRSGHKCETPINEMKDLKELIRDTNGALNELKLTHALVYGSLWGAVRYKNPLPWDNDVDIALLDDEISAIDQQKMFSVFNKRGINIYYRLWFGTYRVERNTARGDLMVFRKTFFNEMVRTGLEPWVFFLNHRKFHTVPARLFKKPLPQLLFAGVNISVPRNGIEIQKHFYPHDWWKEMKPSGCEPER